MKTLAYWREMGPVTTTRYPDLYVWKQTPGLWRHLVHYGEGDYDITMDQFRTKGEAMAALLAAAARYCDEPTEAAAMPAVAYTRDLSNGLRLAVDESACIVLEADRRVTVTVTVTDVNGLKDALDQARWIIRGMEGDPTTVVPDVYAAECGWKKLEPTTPRSL